MGAAASAEEVAATVVELGPEAAFGTVADLVKRFDFSGGFLLEAPAEEIGDFLVSRCPQLAALERSRVMYELDCVKRQKKKKAQQEEDDPPMESSLSPTCSESQQQLTISEDSSSEDDDKGSNGTTKERWRDEGSKYLGSAVERSLWDELGTSRVRSRGKIVAWCAAQDSHFLDDKGKKAPLWRATFEALGGETVELEEHEVLEAMAQFRASAVEDAVAKVHVASKKRQRVSPRARHEVIVVAAPVPAQPPSGKQQQHQRPPPPPQQPPDDAMEVPKKRGRPRKPPTVDENRPPSALPNQLPSPPRRHETVSIACSKKPRLEMLTTSEAYESGRIPAALPAKAPIAAKQLPPAPPTTRPRRSLAGKRSCRGCHHAPCARTHPACFVGVEATNGKYVASGDWTRYATPLEAARRYEMLHPGANFEVGDPDQKAFEASFRESGDEGADVQTWYLAGQDEEALDLVCQKHHLEKVIAANLKTCHLKHVKSPHKLTPKSKLKRDARLLVSQA